MKSWHLKRRTILKSAGVTVSLPLMECMGDEAAPAQKKRFFGGYFAYGVPMPNDDAEDRLQNGWFPMGEGRNYDVPDMHQCIMPLRDKVRK